MRGREVREELEVAMDGNTRLDRNHGHHQLERPAAVVRRRHEESVRRPVAELAGLDPTFV